MEKTLRNRLTFGPLMIGGVCLLLWLDSAAQHWTRGIHIGWATIESGIGGIGLLLLLMMLMPLATTELATLFAAEKVKPYRLQAGIGSGALAIHAFLTQFHWFQPVAASTLAFVIAFVMLFAALRRAWGRQTQEAIHHMAGTVLAMMYLGGLSWFLMALRVKRSPHFSGSTLVILMIILVVKATDIGGFFGGRAFGKHKLIPWLSPKKTWEGLACGVMLSGAVGAAFAPGIEHLLWWQGMIFGLIIGPIGQAGDLLESMMKRDADVKDSGNLVPGFGGILDIIDSPLLAAPFAYILFSVF